MRSSRPLWRDGAADTLVLQVEQILVKLVAMAAIADHLRPDPRRLC